VTSEPNYDVIRQRVEKRFKKRQELIIHSIAFVLGNIMVWTIFGLTGGRFPWPLLVTLSWGMGLLGHALYYNIEYGSGAQRREAAIEREVEREHERSLAYEKPKNDTHLRLTDDGEIEEIHDDAISQAEKLKNR
jgi:2TM domain